MSQHQQDMFLALTNHCICILAFVTFGEFIIPINLSFPMCSGQNVPRHNIVKWNTWDQNTILNSPMYLCLFWDSIISSSCSLRIFEPRCLNYFSCTGCISRFSNAWGHMFPISEFCAFSCVDYQLSIPEHPKSQTGHFLTSLDLHVCNRVVQTTKIVSYVRVCPSVCFLSYSKHSLLRFWV